MGMGKGARGDRKKVKGRDGRGRDMVERMYREAEELERIKMGKRGEGVPYSGTLEGENFHKMVENTILVEKITCLCC